MLLPVIQQQQDGGQLPQPVPTQVASYSVQVAWSGVVSNAFRLDRSTLDGTDILTNLFSATFTGEYDELVGMTGYGVKSVRTRRGREDDLGQMGAGEATVVLHDPDGRFNPQNPSSPLAGQILPMRHIRIAASNDGVTSRPMFRGFIRSVEHDPRRDAQETTINAVDLVLWMSRVYPVIDATGPTTTGAAIGRVLDAMGFSDPDLISLDTGDPIPGFEADGSATALALVEGLLEAERGVFYLSAAGVATFEDRHRRSLRVSSATLNDTFMATRPGIDLDRIANRARVTRTGGEEQTAADADSVGTYGISDLTGIDSPYIRSDVQAQSLARYLVSQRAHPSQPMWGLNLINRDITTMQLILDRELQDRLTVVDSRGGSNGDFHVESIEHEVTDGGKYHRSSWVLADAAAGSVFVVGRSLVAGPDLISY